MSRTSIHADLKRKHPGEYPESCADVECRERQALLAVADAADSVLAPFVVQTCPNRYECRACEADVTEASAFMRPLVHGDDCEVRRLVAALAALEAAE